MPDAWVAVLLGVADADERHECITRRLVPVLNHPGQIGIWCKSDGTAPPGEALLHIDTGMTRLGLTATEFDRLLAKPPWTDGWRPSFLMSHLACAEDSANPKNAAQFRAFARAHEQFEAAFGQTRASLANSSGIFLGPDYHQHLVRPGVALYGVNPTLERSNPMAHVVSLSGKIVQVQEAEAGQTIGYGATHTVSERSRIATVSVGYADGYLRSASPRASAHLDGVRAPIVGRVSMDLITFDVSGVPPAQAQPGAMMELIGPDYPVDALAADSGTIGYEILTSLGARYRRRYLEQGGDPTP